MTDEHKEKLKQARERAKAARTGGSTNSTVASSVNASEGLSDDVVSLLKNLTNAVSGINKRLNKIETGGANEFKEAARPEDIARAGETRRGVDQRVLDIVDKTLGEDFGVEMGTFPDRPGFLFTLIVPQRLSDSQVSERPVKDPETGGYAKDKYGNTVTESYFPQDRRSRALSSEQSFDAVKEHCERVRSYIVAYYTKMSKPLPEFKLK